ncbi:MAG: enoyl-CoA hydratase-related protein [Proteobacteria bacterium]|jgi:enoyl-CoA hydratase|nr:enoyl-CoA hydratase-related protein [Pseudomonadota bacterium]MDA1299606.1 enoyl-CoA hydratase-related protein [Pseudomonadota bacterium]
MSYHHVRYAVEGNIAIVTLARPHFRNAQSRVLLEELDHAFLTASDDDAVKVIILTGEGEHFSAGHDLGTAEEQQDQQDHSNTGFPSGKS